MWGTNLMATTMKKHSSPSWDVVVIGGGPAGMMAAGRAAEKGKSVLILEKNESLGKKLLITGGGRCNVTNNKPDMENLVSQYKDRPKPLFSVFSRYGVEQTLEFFHSRGMETKVEPGDRVFPASNKAQSVWDVLNEYMNSNKVTIRTNSAVQGLKVNKSGEIVVQTTDEEIVTKSCIVATGGLSHPDTGSTGDGYKWLESLGHEIVDNSLALVPIAIKEDWVKKLTGVSLDNIRINIWQDGKKKGSTDGRILFTHFGISGPTVMNMSSTVGEILETGDVLLTLDLHPNTDEGDLKQQLTALFQEESKKAIKNSIRQMLPSSIITSVLELAQIDGETPGHSVSKEQKKKLLMLIKGLPMNVKRLMGADMAVLSAGGIKTEDINFQTMESRITPNVYVVGDMLNVDKPSGGYSLQLCWSTGYVAGDNC